MLLGTKFLFSQIVGLSHLTCGSCRAVHQLTLDGVAAAAAKCDVTQKSEVEQLVAWTVETYGSLDIMIANAGIVKGADFLDITEEDWDAVMDVNLKGAFIVRFFYCFSCGTPQSHMLPSYRM